MRAYTHVYEVFVDESIRVTFFLKAEKKTHNLQSMNGVLGKPRTGRVSGQVVQKNTGQVLGQGDLDLRPET